MREEYVVLDQKQYDKTREALMLDELPNVDFVMTQLEVDVWGDVTHIRCPFGLSTSCAYRLDEAVEMGDRDDMKEVLLMAVAAHVVTAHK